MANERDKAARARLAQAYRNVFGVDRRTEDQQVVLEDLAMFCRANESEFDPDVRVHALKSGRREIWLRIQQHLHLNDAALFDLYTGVAVRPMPRTLTETVKDIEEKQDD